MSNRAAMVIVLTVGLITAILLLKVSYFPEPYTHSKIKIKVELHLPYYATKPDFKNRKSC